MRQPDTPQDGSHQTLLIKRQVHGSLLEYCPADKYARTAQYVQQQQQLQGTPLMLPTSRTSNTPSAERTSGVSAATTAASAEQQSQATSSSSRHPWGRALSGSLTCAHSLASPRHPAPYPEPPSCSADCSSMSDPEASASSPLDDDDDALQLMDLLKLVQQHKQELEQQFSEEPEAAKALLGSALSDTGTALNVALNAMSLATTMCDQGSPEAADKALEFAEHALTMTVQRLAKAQTLVLKKVEQQQEQGVVLPPAAAEIARDLAAATGAESVSASRRKDTAPMKDTSKQTDVCSSTTSGS